MEDIVDRTLARLALRLLLLGWKAPRVRAWARKAWYPIRWRVALWRFRRRS